MLIGKPIDWNNVPETKDTAPIRCGHCGMVVGSKQACVQPWVYDKEKDYCVNIHVKGGGSKRATLWLQ